MYLGRTPSIAPAERLCDTPLHPYTQALISAIPIPDPGMERSRKKIPIEGEIPSQVNPPIRLCFLPTRCPHAQQRCFPGEALS
jgi:oligopeptide/dipeptide ABC transporter ATP-binding protein